MNVMSMDDVRCRRIRPLLDPYLSNELLVETLQEVNEHLPKCPGCRSALEARRQSRQWLAAAVREQALPVGLETRVVAKLRAEAAPRMGFAWGSWAWAGGGLAALLIAGFFTLERYRVETQRIAAMLGLGRLDHVECTLGGYYPDTPPTKVAMETELGAEYRSLLPAVAEQAQREGLVMREAHQCEWKGRRFVHFILKNDQRLMSVILTKKQAEDPLPRFELLSAMKADGIPVYTASESRFEIAGLESGSHLAFVASNYPAEKNMLLLAQLMPAIRQVR